MTDQTHPRKIVAAPAFRAMAAIPPSLRLPLVVVLSLLVLGWFEPRIIQSGNLWNIAIQASYLTLFAMAQTMVILTRGFDLSLGVTVSLVSVVSAMTMTGGYTGMIMLAIAAGLATGLAVGLTNGVLIAAIGINPLVATLGMSYIILSLASTVSGGFPVPGVPEVFTSVLSGGTVLGVPAPLICALICLTILALVLKFTVFGRALYLIGSNPQAAYVAGIRTTPRLIFVYGLCGTIAAIGALLLTARTGSGEPNLGGGLTLQSIAAAVVGGVRLTGGHGGVGAAMTGAVFVTLLSNAMNLNQMDGYIQDVLLGLIIILSLILNQRRQKH